MFNNIRPTDDSILDSITQHEPLENLGVTPTITEVRNATRKRANRKAASKNKVPLEGYKYLSEDNFSHLYVIVVEFWTGNDDPPEFHEAKLYIIQEKGDLRLLKNYKQSCLLDVLDVVSKVISVIIVDRCQSVLKLHGLDEQNGFLNKKGCMVATFALKLALLSRKEFSLDTWMVFVDLVKAFDTVNQEIPIKFSLAKESLIPSSASSNVSIIWSPLNSPGARTSILSLLLLA